MTWRKFQLSQYQNILPRRASLCLRNTLLHSPGWGTHPQVTYLERQQVIYKYFLKGVGSVSCRLCEWLGHMNLKKELNFLWQESGFERKRIPYWEMRRWAIFLGRTEMSDGHYFPCCLVLSIYLFNTPPPHMKFSVKFHIASKALWSSNGFGRDELMDWDLLQNGHRARTE